MAGLNERVVSSPVYRGANQLRPGTHRHLITRAQPAVLDAHAQPGLGCEPYLFSFTYPNPNPMLPGGEPVLVIRQTTLSVVPVL